MIKKDCFARNDGVFSFKSAEMRVSAGGRDEHRKVARRHASGEVRKKRCEPQAENGI